jgi:uncharacterized protein YaiE (UPF0345 family)
MSNILPNGTVLPYGLLSQQGTETAIAAFNKSYRNTGIKAGLVIKSYAADDPYNQNGLCTEYDVVTFEQQENKGSTSILYRNCLSTQGFGSIADYFEFTLRPKTVQTNKGTATFGDQDGAIVLIQCLNNIGDKAIVVGNLIHPDRTTNISSTDPQLAFEYNGVKVAINTDGSFALTFNGPTTSMGLPVGATGNTSFQINSDGSFQFSHATVSINADIGGALTINAKTDCNISCMNATIDAQENVNINANLDTNVKSAFINLNNAAPIPGNGMLTSDSSYGVVDFLTGVPLLPSVTIFGDV